MVRVTTDIVNKLDKQGALNVALLSETLSSGQVACNICQRRCRIEPGGVGYCRTKINYEGVLYDTIYGVISSANADPVEKKPVFHYKPGSRCFSVGALGCNFRCEFCQNWEIAYSDAIRSDGPTCRTGVTPEKLVQLAHASNSQGVAWTYNEPGIWLNYTLDCAKLCKQHNLYTVYVTNGYATMEHLDTIGPYLDVYRVDIKSMEDSFYQKLIKVPSMQGILDVAIAARHKWRMHVECVTNIVPGWNDSEDNIKQTATWIAQNLGSDTPWHITRFFPYGGLSDVPPTPLSTLDNAVKLASECGLKFVYLGNVQTKSGQNTYCPQCGQLLIERSGYKATVRGLDEQGHCQNDGENINVHL